MTCIEPRNPQGLPCLRYLAPWGAIQHAVLSMKRTSSERNRANGKKEEEISGALSQIKVAPTEGETTATDHAQNHFISTALDCRLLRGAHMLVHEGHC